jgi:Tfp pilus assembly protein PilV
MVEPGHPPDGGFTVIEVVAATTVLLVALMAAAALFGNAIIVSGNTRNRVVAQHLATEAIERVRGTAADPTKFVTIRPGQGVRDQTVNGITYTVTEDIQWVGLRSTQSSCDSPASGAGQVLQVTERVTWRQMAGTKPVQATTVLAPPVGAFSSSTGSIAVKVLDAAGEPTANMNVRVQGPVAHTQESTTQGCAFFAFLEPGTYTVSVVEGTGVGDQQELVPAQQTSVSVGETSSIIFSYDRAAHIDVTGADGSAAPPASGLPISVANTGLQPYGQYSFGANERLLTPLFPYASGYTVFAGNCSDNNPLGKDNSGNALYPNAAPSVVAVTAGATTGATYTLYDLAVTVVDGTGAPQPSASVSITSTTTFPSPYTVVCTAGIDNTAAPVLTLVPADAAGTSVGGVPLGHFTIVGESGPRNGTTDVWVMPDGVYAVDASGAATFPYAGPVPVVVS